MHEQVNLYNLAKRIEMDKRLLETCPDANSSDVIIRHLYKELLLMADCVEYNKDNPLLKEICCGDNDGELERFLEECGITKEGGNLIGN